MHINLAGATIGWLDVPGKMSYLHSMTTNNHADNTWKPITENKGADKRWTRMVNANPRFVANKMIVPMFYNGDQCVTSSQNIFSWNKSNNRRILTGSEFNYNTTTSLFHHTITNMGASIVQASDAYKHGLLGKLDNVQIKLEDFYMHLKYTYRKLSTNF